MSAGLQVPSVVMTFRSRVIISELSTHLPAHAAKLNIQIVRHVRGRERGDSRRPAFLADEHLERNQCDCRLFEKDATHPSPTKEPERFLPM